MAKSNNTLCLDKFYPEKDLMITDIDQQSDKIIIQMKSTSSSCKCPKCNRITQKYHGTYTRKVQDLPILRKNVQLEICSHEYSCLNTELSDNHKEYIYEKYPNIWELQCCIKEFRNIFKNHNVPMLYLLSL